MILTHFCLIHKSKCEVNNKLKIVILYKNLIFIQKLSTFLKPLNISSDWRFLPIGR